jgi:hypothetical protein
VNQQVTISGNINVELYHCLGILTVICYSTDTIELGMLPAGTYTTDVGLWAGSGMPDCTTFQSFGNSTGNLTVDAGTGIRNGQMEKPSVFYKDRFIYIQNSPSGAAFSLTDVTGKKVADQHLQDGLNRIDSGDLHGVYLFRITMKDGRNSVGKIAIMAK